MTVLLGKVAFGLSVAAWAVHLTTAGLDEITTPYDPDPPTSCLTPVCK